MKHKQIDFVLWLVFPLILALLLLQAAPPVGAASAAKSWKVVPTPNVAGVNSALYGVSAISSGTAWAVGNVSSTSTPNIDRTMVQHWNGKQWSIVSSPNNGAYNNALLSVTAISATNVWAVGDYNRGVPPNQTLTEQWNGKKWSVVKSPNSGTDVNELLSVTGIPYTQNVWAVGQYFDTASHLWAAH